MSNTNPMTAIVRRFEEPASISRIKAVAPSNVDPTRLVRMALMSIAKTAKLAQCKPDSLLLQVCDAAALGLTCGGGTQEAYLVPFKDTATLIIGYRGLVKLARQSGEIASISAEAVYRGDEFDYELGLEPRLRHKPMGETDDNKITHVYAIAKFKDGGFQMVVMTKSQVDKIRSRSRASDGGPWVTDYAEMAKKTAIRRLCKLLPLTVQAQEAISKSDDAEFGDMAIDGETQQPVTDKVDDAIAAAKARTVRSEIIDAQTGEVTNA